MNYFKNLFDINDPHQSKIGVFGLADELKSVYISNLYGNGRNTIVVTSNMYIANKLYQSLSSVNDNVLLYPMDEFVTSEAVAISPEFKNERIDTLHKLATEDKKYIVITPLMGYLRFNVTPECFVNSVVKVSVGEEVTIDSLKEKFVSLGYTRNTAVSASGEFALRGHVLDVFPISEKTPIRIEFWGDEVESIRSFSLDTQLSIENVDSVEIIPYLEFIVTDKEIEVGTKALGSHEYEYRDNDIENILIRNNLNKYHKYMPLFKETSNLLEFGNEPNLVIYNYTDVESHNENLVSEVFEYHQSLIENKRSFIGLEYMNTYQELYQAGTVYMSDFAATSNIKFDRITDYKSKDVDQFYNDYDALNSYIKQKLEDEYQVFLSLNTQKQLNNLSDVIKHNYVIINEGSKVHSGCVNAFVGDFVEGFDYMDEKITLITTKEILGTQKTKKTYKNKYKFTEKITNVNQLHPGDYVVHTHHGIGMYVGMKTIETKKDREVIKKDVLHIEYKGKDNLYLPMDQIKLIQKYSSYASTRPKMHKLGGSEWETTKRRIKAKVNDLADWLLDLQARREATPGFNYSPDTAMQTAFEGEFEYTETPDQLRVIGEIKKDMEKAHPMDRLVCGDVGFGKTEVALRAAFKAIQDDKQVAYLCPTTVLSRQHYETTVKRFENYPFNIALLNRFTTPKEVKRIIAKIKMGGVDMLIGTHRLLSKDIIFKDLGLLIVDEEQRFGVEHKEKLKQLKVSVDVVTLTATPIPRTLQMSMVGIRSLSLLETPPQNRYPIQTYVIEENNQVIKEAIEREVARGGQVFILHNRVSDIVTKTNRIRKLVKGIDVEFAHGQMSKGELTEKMNSFIDGEFSVLVSTTIIETGIDIPNANTLIILDADKFGLSQLYQLRGRVGRSNKVAYAYLMFQPKKVLSTIAQKRLRVIKDFTELGSGFKIAMRDLSIRGAGDILGGEQAGFIETVGIELYTKMLEDAIKVKKGTKKPDAIEETIKSMANVSTHIPTNYILDDQIRIQVHKQIRNIKSVEDLERLKAQLSDKYGKIPDEVINYIDKNLFDYYANKLGIKKVVEKRNYVTLEIPRDMSQKIDGARFLECATKTSRFIRFTNSKGEVHIIIDTVRESDFIEVTNRFLTSYFSRR